MSQNCTFWAGFSPPALLHGKGKPVVSPELTPRCESAPKNAEQTLHPHRNKGISWEHCQKPGGSKFPVQTRLENLLPSSINPRNPKNDLNKEISAREISPSDQERCSQLFIRAADERILLKSLHIPCPSPDPWPQRTPSHVCAPAAAEQGERKKPLVLPR